MLIHPLRRYTICTTRCGFVNVAFGFAARKVSRHQLYKHVNAHVYLGVWRITLNSVQAVVGIHMIMSINRLLRTKVYTCWLHGVPGAVPDCTRAFALHALRTKYAIS